MRVLVTGGAGRLGRSVVAGLTAVGHEVISVDLAHSRDGHPSEDGVRRLPADLTVAAECEKLIMNHRPAAVVHLAGIAVPFSVPDRATFLINATLAFGVVEAAVTHGVALILAASSPTPLGYGAPGGWLPDYLPIDEDHPLRPWNAYALSKQTIENVIMMFARQCGDAVRLGAFRPCFVLSPEEWQGAPTQQGHTVHDRLDDPVLAAVSLFNYVDARDAAAFVDRWLAAAGEVPNGSIYYVGAADALARRPLAELLPQHLPGSEHLADGLTGTAPAFSIAKAARDLGWRPRHAWRTELAAPAPPEEGRS